ncbi:MAG: F0F1 ATP synthase subunit delta [Gallionella sp.]|nr:F0F1 ATP synthase subunit delta [Gallionella sp.]
MSEAITTARPYAQAAFDEAQQLSDLKGWSEMLVTLAESVCHPEVRLVATNPRIAKSRLENLMEALTGGKPTVQQRNFVRILVENQRLLLLPEIAAIYEALRAEAEKTLNVEVDSAYELSAAQQERIISSLKAKMGCEIKLSCKINKELLGGVIIRAGDKVIDGSARTRLTEMANALA